jgi:Fe-S cluster biogenesis protein NfuA
VTPGQDLRAVGDRIEHLLDELHATAEPSSWARAEEVLALVTELYGAGLARIVEFVDDATMARLLSDELVASLLVLHGLHPDDLAARVEQALEEVRPYLAAHSGDVELIGVDDELSAVCIRLLGSCHGCPSSSITLKLAVEKAIMEAAPEVTRIVVEGEVDHDPPAPTPGTPIQLGRKPGVGSPSSAVGVRP